MTALTTTQVAEKLETTPRTLRKFLRADAKEQGTETPGKGSRYSIEGKEVAGLKKRFKVWNAAEAQARKDRAEKAASEAQAEVEAPEVDDEPELDDMEPTDADLAELDA